MKGNFKENCMHRMTRKAPAAVLLLMALSLLAACSGQAPAATQALPTQPVMLVTQVVTQVVPPTVAPPTATAAPTATEIPPTPTPTFNPFSAPIYYPLKDCVASRLHIGDRAQVSLQGGPNGIRYGSDLRADTIIGYAQPGAILEIVNGPFCSQGWILWFVRTGDGTVGYTPEGDGNTYWLLPTQK
jgi:hypothetical protein